MMKFKQYTHFQVDFSSKWTSACAACLGLSFFLRIAYYFALVSFRDVSIIELLTSGIIGIALCGTMAVYLKFLHRNAPGLYGIAGMIHCLLVVILSFTTGSAGRIILSLLWYGLTALILFATVGGYLPGRLLAALMFAVSIFVRLFFFDLGHIGLIQLVQEFAVLSSFAAFSCFAMGLKPIVSFK